jgi:hypothetical protein
MLNKYFLKEYMTDVRISALKENAVTTFSKAMLLVIWGSSRKGFEKKAMDLLQALF